MQAYEAATAWRDLGVACIPIIWRDKAPALRSWKRYQDTLPRDRELRTWFNGRRTNLAVITGWRGLVVVDFDDPLAYSRWVISMPPAHLLEALRTYQVRTARGRHLYFYCEDDVDTHPAIRPGIDIKANGGYVLGYPSKHPAGHRYTPRRSPSNIITVPGLSWLQLQPDREESHDFSSGAEPPSMWEQAMQPTCAATISDIKRLYTSAGLLGLATGYRHKLNCPLPGHNDDHASFVLYRDGHFHCYGCGGHGGDVIDLYAALHDLSIREAMRAMAREKGII